MVYDYIIENYQNGEPIFLSELPGASRDYIRQEMKRLVDEDDVAEWITASRRERKL